VRLPANRRPARAARVAACAVLRRASVKTNQLPYEEVVTAILVTACLRTGIAPRSDGTYADWAPGIGPYELACGPVPSDALELLRQSLDNQENE
jgi:hypothetical protein